MIIPGNLILDLAALGDYLEFLGWVESNRFQALEDVPRITQRVLCGDVRVCESDNFLFGCRFLCWTWSSSLLSSMLPG